MFNRIKATLGAAALAGFAATAAQADVTLRWGHYLGDSNFLQAEKDFATAVTERTEGRVTIEITFAGGLGAGNEVLTLAGRGAIDMASVVPGYYADQLLFWRAYQIPFIFESPRQAMEISAAAYQDLPYFQEELDKFGVKFLFHQPLGGYYLTGPDESCDSLDNLAGKKIRSFGADIPKAHEAIGAVPVSVGVGDVYEALQRGSLDYSFLNRGNILANRLYEPGQFSCGPVMAITGHLIVISNDQWDAISAEDQAVMLEEAQKAGTAYIDNIEAAEEAAGEKIVEAGGVIKPFPAEELAKWKAAAPDLLQNWVDDMDGRGMGDAAAEVATYWRAIIDGS
ncbi:MAG: TRAP transporter substrate-binding protein DctP [Alphaproteobacteria bacterium]|nr:TRAP transporter substrate-binding protein DctP [Alphaproteobacteria bacterium]NNF23273.1 TRAP transporter substrate-binding protein DctP [Paracoccaceae bacterium]